MGYGFSGRSSLNYKKKRNEFSNSNGTCTIHCQSLKAYSYAEVIAAVIFCKKTKENTTVYNDFTFSSTTTKHQWVVYRHNVLKTSKEFSINVSSMNNFVNNPKLEYLENAEYSENLIKFVEYFFGKNKDVKKFLAERKKALEENVKWQKEQAAEKRLEKSLQTLNFKTISGFLKALEKFRTSNKCNTTRYLAIREHRNKYSSRISDEKLLFFYDVLKNPENNLDLSYVSERMENLRNEKITQETFKQLGA